MLKISFIIPCYKSEQTISFVIDEIMNKIQSDSDYDYEVIAVDDCSPDGVYNILSSIAEKNSHCKVIRFAKNFGQHAAMMAGLKYASGDIMVLMDDDGQCPLPELDRLLDPLLSGKADVSIASYGIKKQSWFKNLGSFINEFSANRLIDKPKDIQMGNFMAFRCYVAKELVQYEGPYPYISGLLFRSCDRIINVPMEERYRLSGRTTYSFHKLLSLWLNSFTAFSIKPLRFASFIGLLTAMVGFVYSLIIMLRKIINPEVLMGYSSIMCALLFIGGMLMLMIGLVGEYIGRIYICLNRSPQYVIKDKINIDE